MKEKNKFINRILKEKKGASLILTIITLSILVIIAGVMTTISLSTYNLSYRNFAREQAFISSEAALKNFYKNFNDENNTELRKKIIKKLERKNDVAKVKLQEYLNNGIPMNEAEQLAIEKYGTLVIDIELDTDDKAILTDDNKAKIEISTNSLSNPGVLNIKSSSSYLGYNNFVMAKLNKINDSAEKLLNIMKNSFYTNTGVVDLAAKSINGDVFVTKPAPGYDYTKIKNGYESGGYYSTMKMNLDGTDADKPNEWVEVLLRKHSHFNANHVIITQNHGYNLTKFNEYLVNGNLFVDSDKSLIGLKDEHGNKREGAIKLGFDFTVFDVNWFPNSGQAITETMLTIKGDVHAMGDARVENLFSNGNLYIKGNAWLDGYLHDNIWYSSAILTTSVIVNGNVHVGKNLHATQPNILGDLYVNGNTFIEGFYKKHIINKYKVYEDGRPAYIGGNLYVDGSKSAEPVLVELYNTKVVGNVYAKNAIIYTDNETQIGLYYEPNLEWKQKEAGVIGWERVNSKYRTGAHSGNLYTFGLNNMYLHKVSRVRNTNILGDLAIGSSLELLDANRAGFSVHGSLYVEGSLQIRNYWIGFETWKYGSANGNVLVRGTMAQISRTRIYGTLSALGKNNINENAGNWSNDETYKNTFAVNQRGIQLQASEIFKDLYSDIDVELFGGENNGSFVRGNLTANGDKLHIHGYNGNRDRGDPADNHQEWHKFKQEVGGNLYSKARKIQFSNPGQEVGVVIKGDAVFNNTDINSSNRDQYSAKLYGVTRIFHNLYSTIPLYIDGFVYNNNRDIDYTIIYGFIYVKEFAEIQSAYVRQMVWSDWARLEIKRFSRIAGSVVLTGKHGTDVVWNNNPQSDSGYNVRKRTTQGLYISRSSAAYGLDRTDNWHDRAKDEKPTIENGYVRSSVMHSFNTLMVTNFLQHGKDYFVANYSEMKKWETQDCEVDNTPGRGRNYWHGGMYTELGPIYWIIMHTYGREPNVIAKSDIFIKNIAVNDASKRVTYLERNILTYGSLLVSSHHNTYQTRKGTVTYGRDFFINAKSTHFEAPTDFDNRNIYYRKREIDLYRRGYEASIATWAYRKPRLPYYINSTINRSPSYNSIERMYNLLNRNSTDKINSTKNDYEEQTKKFNKNGNLKPIIWLPAKGEDTRNYISGGRPSTSTTKMDYIIADNLYSDGNLGQYGLKYAGLDAGNNAHHWTINRNIKFNERLVVGQNRDAREYLTFDTSEGNIHIKATKGLSVLNQGKILLKGDNSVFIYIDNEYNDDKPTDEHPNYIPDLLLENKTEIGYKKDASVNTNSRIYIVSHKKILMKFGSDLLTSAHYYAPFGALEYSGLENHESENYSFNGTLAVGRIKLVGNPLLLGAGSLFWTLSKLSFNIIPPTRINDPFNELNFGSESSFYNDADKLSTWKFTGYS